MIIYPAIDLLGGKCVRLYQGDYGQVTEYSADPVEVACSMAEQGADWIHVVDLDAARTGTGKNRQLICRMVAESGLKVQAGGGIRDLKSLESLLSAGVSRCVIGTAAVRDPDFLTQALAAYRDELAVGIDCRDGRVRVAGWLEDAGLEPLALARQLAEMGVKMLIYTEISRDGALAGPALQKGEELIRKSGLEVVMSGGIASLQDVAACQRIGSAGVIIGKALYEGKVDLRICLENASSPA